jgi:hypothetical protein
MQVARQADQTVPTAAESERFGTFAPSRSNYLVTGFG